MLLIHLASNHFPLGLNATAQAMSRKGPWCYVGSWDLSSVT
jgi:hypothetical protein